MNLQTIQKRVEELSAELITVSNDLAFLIQGDVTRDTSTSLLVTHWSQLKEGDTIVAVQAFEDCVGGAHPAGTYTVGRVESADYDNLYQLEVEGLWMEFNKLKAYKVA